MKKNPDLKKEDLQSLRELLEMLECKTPHTEITDDSHDIVQSFLMTEQQHRRDHRIKRLMTSSGIRPNQIRTFDGFDWLFNPDLPKNDILSFRNSDWIAQANNVVFIGDTGTGKTHLSKALCHDAILKGESAYFISAFDLIGKIKGSVRPETKVTYFGSTIKVLCIDELGYTQQSKEAGDLLFQIIAKRSETLPTIITTNLLPKQWGSIFAGPAATAMLDRLSYNGKFMTMEGPSYRMREKRK
jgi:DNA replication protein DnaC